MKFIRTRIAFYDFLEVIFLLAWLPFGLIETLLLSLVKWTQKKKHDIWTRLAAEAIQQNSKETKEWFDDIENRKGK